MRGRQNWGETERVERREGAPREESVKRRSVAAGHGEETESGLESAIPRPAYRKTSRRKRLERYQITGSMQPSKPEADASRSLCVPDFSCQRFERTIYN